MKILEISGMRKSFSSSESSEVLKIFDAFGLEVAQGERIAISGPSGCGKSTLLNLIAGLSKVDGGDLQLLHQAKLAYMFQEPRLLPWLSVEDNLMLVTGGSQAGNERIDEVLAAVGLSDKRLVFASKLSLGMARRVALARSFIVEPDLLLMDEPFVSLDASNAARLRDLLLGLLSKRKAAMLFVTHDIREAISVSDRLIFLSAPPAHIELDIHVPLSEAERRDERAVEDFRFALLEAHNLDSQTLEVALDEGAT